MGNETEHASVEPRNAGRGFKYGKKIVGMLTAIAGGLVAWVIYRRYSLGRGLEDATLHLDELGKGLESAQGTAEDIERVVGASREAVDAIEGSVLASISACDDIEGATERLGEELTAFQRILRKYDE